MTHKANDATPTPQDRRTARMEGRVVRSQEVVFALGFTIAGLAIWGRASHLADALRQLIRSQLQVASSALWHNSLPHLSQQTLAAFAAIVAPLLGLVCATVVLAHWLQHGPLWNPGRVVPDFERLQPSAGFRRMVHRGAFFTTSFVTIIRVVFVLGAAGWVVWRNAVWIGGLGALPLNELLSASAGILFRIFGGAAIAMLLVAGIDFAIRLWRFEVDLRSELKQERESIKAVQNDLTGKR